jgi:hypothetical protein
MVLVSVRDIHVVRFGSLSVGSNSTQSGAFHMARRPNPALHAVWRDRIQRQLTSGLSIEQFCAQGQIARSAFYRWRHQLGLTSRAKQLPAPRTPSQSPSRFLPVTVHLVDRETHGPAPIEAELPNGIRLRIPTADGRLACRLVRAVARAKTRSGGSQ